MKVLLIHNYYKASSPSGEDVVFENEMALLKRNGVEVVVYKKNNDEITKYSHKVAVYFGTVWSRKAYQEIKQLIKKENPNIIHIHNVWYLISPSVYYACADMGVPVIQTVHNFRIICTNGLLLKDGKICELCIGKKPWRGSLYGCYRNSRLCSFPIVAAECFHNIMQTWNNKITAFIAPSHFVKSKLEECGIRSEKIFLKPHFTDKKADISEKPQNYGVFIGRISKEKGVGILIEAVKELRNAGLIDFSLKIIGDGPERSLLVERIEAEGILGIHFLGKRSYHECMDILKKSKFLIIPSICYETFSMSVIEALSCGKPVIASKLGALQEIIVDNKTGFLFDPANKMDLAAKMTSLIKNNEMCLEMGRHALDEFSEKYNATKNYEALIEIYSQVLCGEKG